MTFLQAFGEAAKDAAIGAAAGLVIAVFCLIAGLLFWTGRYVIFGAFVVIAVTGALAISARFQQRRVNRL